MICVAQSSKDLYSQRLAKTRANVLNSLYGKKSVVEIPQQKTVSKNDRLRLRYNEAIRDALDICKNNKNSKECHSAWYEVDELEDAMMRYNLKD